MDKDFFVQKVKFLCLQKGIKPTNACKESGVGGSFLSDINRGQVPSVAKVQMLAEYLGVTTSDLLGEKISPVGLPANGREEEFTQLFSQLTPDQQELVLAQLKGIVDAKDK
ncbi:helix-turn-helix domain-containing protein [Flavonifractor sp. An9]|uniref:helix-turn-helix domain-containing protein n=1 Tax=Flavonifractor sp. An9 TaxID=1965664 RepID=UPI000B37E418|nr:helix-turn-helix transcriptional regulator [Flavonifractor sp. An9]OUN09089.1 hypothetical protein B5G40_13540 [Flavonifractor sp. An9]